MWKESEKDGDFGEFTWFRMSLGLSVLGHSGLTLKKKKNGCNISFPAAALRGRCKAHNGCKRGTIVKGASQKTKEEQIW